MAEHYGWIAKYKHGDFWYGTLGKEKEDVESHFEDSRGKYEHNIKIVKVKLVEVKEKEEKVQCPACGRWISIKATSCICQLEEEE